MKLYAIIISVSLMFFSVLNAEELNLESKKKVDAATSTTAKRESAVSSQHIFINPETGEIDTNPAPETVAEAAAQMSAEKIAAEPETTATQQADGSIRIDFGDQYMMTIYAHLNADGTASLSHEDHNESKEE